MVRRTPLPTWVRSVGRVLAAEEVDGDAWLVLTPAEVLLTTAEGDHWRQPWHAVETGEWDGESHTLTISWVGGGRDVVTTVNDRPRDLPLAFRERVDASVVHMATAAATGGGTLRAVVRRDGDGNLLTQVVGVGRIRPSATLDAEINALEARVRDAVGLPPLP